jgi:O-acetylserine/cysteine efflux transporter
MSRTSLPPLHLAAVLLVTVLWGGNVVAIKLTTVAIPPFLAMALRFGAVALILCPFYRPDPGMLRYIFPVSLVMGIGHFGLLFVGLSGMDVATGAVVTQLGVPFSVVLSWLLLNDRLDAKRIIGLGLAFLGVVVLAGAPGHADLLSVMIVIISDIMWAAAMLLIKRAPPMPPMVFNGWMALMAAPMLLGLSLILETGHMTILESAPLSAWEGLAYTIVGASLIAHTLWIYMLRFHPLSRVVPFTLLAPVVGFAVGAFYLGETISAFKIIGGLMTMVGVAIIEVKLPFFVSDTEST